MLEFHGFKEPKQGENSGFWAANDRGGFGQRLGRRRGGFPAAIREET